VNFEGIAVRNGIVHVEFHGPVLRANYVPILKLRFDGPDVSTKNIVYVKLGGRGIWDLARVSDGFLILAGPLSTVSLGWWRHGPGLWSPPESTRYIKFIGCYCTSALW
jgi:hypothetical protein